MSGYCLTIVDWLNKQWNSYRAYNDDRELFINTMKQTEREVGRVALQSIQTLIKIKHLDEYGDKYAGCFRMDGNADNYIELDDVELDKEYQYLVDTAQRLLRYGF